MSATDDRIKRILAIRAEEEKAAGGQQTRQAEIEEQARKKWGEDTHTISEILKDFEQKMSKIKVQLQFKDAGPRGSAIAVGQISGQVSGRELKLSFNLHPNGELHIFSEGPKIGVRQIHPALSILTADRAAYELVVLDAIEAA